MKDKMRHIERYTFPYLCHLMNLQKLSSDDAQKYGDWFEKDRYKGTKSQDILRHICNAGSDNHPYLLMACSLWSADKQSVELHRLAWIDLLNFQLSGRCPWDDMQELALWEHTETHSTTYSSFRWVSVLAVWKWAKDHHDATLSAACQTYCQAMAAWWGLGAVMPWNGLKERQNASGGLYDPTFLVPACGERSTMAHAFQNDLGSLLAHAFGGNGRSKRMNPHARLIVDAVPGDYCVQAFEVAPPYIRKSLVNRVEFLQRLGIRTNREIIWEFWPDVTLVYCPGPRLNGNTPDTKASLVDTSADRRLEIAFPWTGGRGKATKGEGGDCVRKPGAVVCSGNLTTELIDSPKEGFDFKRDIWSGPILREGDRISLIVNTPLAAPDLKIVINREGVKIS